MGYTYDLPFHIYRTRFGVHFLCRPVTYLSRGLCRNYSSDYLRSTPLFKYMFPGERSVLVKIHSTGSSFQEDFDFTSYISEVFFHKNSVIITSLNSIRLCLYKILSLRGLSVCSTTSTDLTV